MKAIDREAQAVMDRLTVGLNETLNHRKINNADGIFMPVTAEWIGKCDSGTLFSIAHYYEQNGDMMRDPEMIFLKGHDGKYYPTYFRQDTMWGIPVEQESIVIHEGKPLVAYPRMQEDHVSFANVWMRNIKEQQKLEV